LFRYFHVFRFFNIVESNGNGAYFVIFCIFRFFNIVRSGESEAFLYFNNTMELYIIFRRIEER
jgi:hypothetical protein